MTVLEQIQQQLQHLPQDKQNEVLDFVTFLRQQSVFTAPSQQTRPSERSLRQHPAFGAWRERNIDALTYEQNLRAEWDD